MTHGDVTVNLRESMEYLTTKIDRADVISGTFVQENWAQIELLAQAKAPLDLLSNHVPPELKQLSDTIWGQIAIHAIHQQHCKNFVQLAGPVSLAAPAEP